TYVQLFTLHHAPRHRILAAISKDFSDLALLRAEPELVRSLRHSSQISLTLPMMPLLTFGVRLLHSPVPVIALLAQALQVGAAVLWHRRRQARKGRQVDQESHPSGGGTFVMTGPGTPNIHWQRQ